MQAEETEQSDCDANAPQSEARYAERGASDEGLLAESVDEDCCAEDHADEEDFVASGELFCQPLVGHPLAKPRRAALVFDLVDVHLLGEPLREHEHEASCDEERGQGDNEAREPRLIDHVAVEPANGSGAGKGHQDGPADMDALAHEEARDKTDHHGRSAGHDAGRKIELATNHEQGDGGCHHAVRGRNVEPVQCGAGSAECLAVPPQEGPHHDGADEGTDLWRNQPAAHRAAVGNTFVACCG